MRRPEINETAEETVSKEISTGAGIDAWEQLTNYISNLEAYADVLEQQLEQPAPDTSSEAATARIVELGNALADAQARLHSIGLLTR